MQPSPPRLQQRSDLAAAPTLARRLAVVFACALVMLAAPVRGSGQAGSDSRPPGAAATDRAGSPAARVGTLAPARRLVKPQPPLDVKLEALDPLQPGRVARFRLTAVPRVPAEEMRIVARPAAEVAWVAGSRAERRSARRDEPSEFAFSVRVPAHGRHALHVTVEVTAVDGTVWRRGVGLGLGPDPRAERARVVPDGRGGEALEFEAAPAAPGSGR